jgi:uncharacterized protein (TIGR03437 family)
LRCAAAILRLTSAEWMRLGFGSPLNNGFVLGLSASLSVASVSVGPSGSPPRLHKVRGPQKDLSNKSRSSSRCLFEGCRKERPVERLGKQEDHFQMKRSAVIVFLAAAVASAQTMKELVKPYLVQALDNGNSFVSVSAASGLPVIAPDSLVSSFGTNLAASTASAPVPYPTELGGIRVQVIDSAGNSQQAPLLYVSPEQINFLMPSGTAEGPTTINLIGAGGTTGSGMVQNQKVAPALFTANGNGQGVVAATAYRTFIPGTRTAPVAVFQCGTAPGTCASIPIDPGLDAPVTITLSATGIKGRSSDAAVTLTIGNSVVPICSITSSDDNGPMPAVDQIIFGLPLNLRGSGEVDVVLTVDGVDSNHARINIQ